MTLPAGSQVVNGLPAVRTSAAVRRRAAIKTLAVDVQTTNVMSAFSAARVEALLLKGPAIARLLYTDGEERPYADSDLLVSPRTLPAAEETLRRLGYEREVRARSMAIVGNHGYAWRRSGSSLAVDLHHTLPGVAGDPGELWEALREHTILMTLQGISVPAPDAAALAFHVALHAAHHGIPTKKPLRDLERAVKRVDMDQWCAAARLAERVDATDAFGVGLRLLPDGGVLAAELDLPPNRSRRAALRASGSPSVAICADRLLATSGARATATLLLRKICPPPDFMRLVTPLARKGKAGLVIAYLWRPLSVARLVIPAARAWWQVGRETTKLPPGDARS